MSNSRARFLQSEEKPSNTSKGKGLILETPYRPGFVEDKDLESVKMAVDKELSDISNAFYQTTERTAESIKRIDKLELNIGDNLQGLIQKEEEIRKEQDGILAQKIETVRAESASGIAEVKETTSALSDGLGRVEAKWGVQTNVNDKIAGIQLNNDGKSSSFSVVADRFTISDGTSDSAPPFEVVGNSTRIKSAYVETITSDNWHASGGAEGWAITNGGWAKFNNVEVRGTVYATGGSFTGDVYANNGVFNGTVNASGGTFNGTVNANAGVFNNVTINANCQFLGTVTGSLNIQDQSGNVGMKITNNQILIYDEQGRLRVKMGRL